MTIMLQFLPTKRSVFTTLYLAILLVTHQLILCGNAAYAKQSKLMQVNILADPSLSIPLTIIARDYSREHGVAVSNAFAETHTQSLQIVDEGVEADIFITTDEKVIQDLKNRGVVDVYSQTAIADNRLVLATNSDNDIKLGSTDIIAQLTKQNDDFMLAIGDPEFLLVGQYALPAMQKLGWYNKLQDAQKNHLLYVFSDRDMHRAVEAKEGYGIMFQSDVKRNEKLRSIMMLPENSHKPIRYYAVVIAGENMNIARSFMEYLVSEKAQGILKKAGFELP